jgi:diguanylate cyclase
LLAALHQATRSLTMNAFTDTVTQLPNRRALLEDMQRRLASGQDDPALIVAFIGLDDFKPINERLGHEAGDQFLQAIAKRIRRMLRDSDMAARFGGEQFVVLAEEQRAKAEHAAVALARRLESATQGRFKLDSTLIDYDGASIGVVVAEPGCSSAQALLSRAATAMDRIKGSRKLGASVRVPVKAIARYEWPVIE